MNFSHAAQEEVGDSVSLGDDTSLENWILYGMLIIPKKLLLFKWV